MSIINIQGFNPTNFSAAMNPVSNVGSNLSSAANSAQSGIMQQLSALFSSLSQLFSMGAQNPQFSANPNSANIGNNLGRDNLGQPQVVSGNGNNIGQPNPGLISCGTGNGTGVSNGNDLSQLPMNGDRAAQVLNKEFDNLKGSNDTVDRGDLRRALNDPNSSPELKQAASFLLNNPNEFRKLETADQRAEGKGGLSAMFGDGKISKGDTTAAMARSNSTQLPAERDATATLLEHKNSLMGGDGCISKDELASIAVSGKLSNGQPAPADLQNAAKFFTQNPEMFNKLEDTNFYRNPGSTTNKSDGKIGLQDMLTALSQ